MHIGLDLDNTILDATTAHLRYYNEASGLSFTPEDVNDFYIYRLYGWNKTERDAVYHKYGHDIHWNSAPLPSAIEIVRELFHEHQISIITSRPMIYRDVTIAWLKHYQIDYHNIAFFVEDKLHECTTCQVDVLIDDGPHYAEQFALANRPVILYNQPYNLSISNEWVYRAADWMEVKQHIDSLASRGNVERL